MPEPGEKHEMTATEARAGRIVKGGATLRILLVSTVLAILALLIVYFVFFLRG